VPCSYILPMLSWLIPCEQLLIMTCMALCYVLRAFAGASGPSPVTTMNLVGRATRTPEMTFGVSVEHIILISVIVTCSYCSACCRRPAATRTPEMTAGASPALYSGVPVPLQPLHCTTTVV
jgi:hypothetical protein